MTYTRHYIDPDQSVNDRQALADIDEYLGKPRRDGLTQMFRKEMPECTFRQFMQAVSFAGVQGYPVKAWYRDVYPQGIIPEPEDK